MRYGIDDKLTPFPLMLYGLQWLMASLPFAVIVGGIAARAHYAGDADMQTFYLQKMMIIMGLTAVAQVLWGHRLPLVVGPADILLVGVLASLPAGISAIYTSLFISGGLFVLAALSGVLRKAQGLFTPRIIITILCLIALTLAPPILELLYSDGGQAQGNLAFVLLTCFAMLLGNRLLPGIWKSMTLLLGILASSAVYFALRGLPVPPESSLFFGFAASGLLLPSLDINFGTILAFLICYVALFVNEIGSVEAAGQMFSAKDMQGRTGRAVGIFGFSNMVSGLGGVLGSVDYTLSLGIIAASGCASRYTIIPAGLGMALLALFPPVVMLLTCIPGLVMAAVLLHLLTAIISSALSMLAREKAVVSFNHGIVIAFPLMLAVLASFTPENALAQCPDILRPLVGNAFVLSTLTAVLLEHVILKEAPGPA